MSSLFARLLSEASFEILIPAFVLVFVFVGLVAILWQAQKRPDFDVAEFLQDDKGKYSALRAWGFICLGVHCWWVITLVFRDKATENHFLYFGLIWAGTPVALALVQKWTGALPFSPTGSAGTTTTVTESAMITSVDVKKA